mmetsp:Transcript_25267/g.52831  ORF Transcript_25267/g.52831 Transcript_25267/m.52831 type:complete len:207 (+) Transcript_25267:10-630(+)
MRTHFLYNSGTRGPKCAHVQLGFDFSSFLTCCAHRSRSRVLLRKAVHAMSSPAVAHQIETPTHRPLGGVKGGGTGSERTDIGDVPRATGYVGTYLPQRGKGRHRQLQTNQYSPDLVHIHSRGRWARRPQVVALPSSLSQKQVLADRPVAALGQRSLWSGADISALSSGSGTCPMILITMLCLCMRSMVIRLVQGRLKNHNEVKCSA